MVPVLRAGRSPSGITLDRDRGAASLDPPDPILAHSLSYDLVTAAFPTASVKPGKAQSEQILSALPRIADIARTCLNGGEVPEGDIRRNSLASPPV